jgi:hypothetical protein
MRVICIENGGYDDALKMGKSYAVLEDALARQWGQVRVLDELGRESFYPEALFAEERTSPTIPNEGDPLRPESPLLAVGPVRRQPRRRIKPIPFSIAWLHKHGYLSGRKV